MRHQPAARIAAACAVSFAAALPLGGCESEHVFYDVAEDLPDAVEETAETETEAGETGDAGEADAGPPISCSEVLTCMQGCSDAPCIEACQARVCAANADELDALMTCAETECDAECVDFTATECTNCIMAACSAQGFACYGAAC